LELTFGIYFGNLLVKNRPVKLGFSALHYYSTLTPNIANKARIHCYVTDTSFNS